jgi:hypothetical protein
MGCKGLQQLTVSVRHYGFNGWFEPVKHIGELCHSQHCLNSLTKAETHRRVKNLKFVAKGFVIHIKLCMLCKTGSLLTGECESGPVKTFQQLPEWSRYL